MEQKTHLIITLNMLVRPFLLENVRLAIYNLLFMHCLTVESPGHTQQLVFDIVRHTVLSGPSHSYHSTG